MAFEGARLRSHLRIFADGERALGGGEPERARARARHLRETWPGGPLDIDAAILEIRALRALGQDDAARHALAQTEQLAQAQEKTAVLADLRAELWPPHRSGEPVVSQGSATDDKDGLEEDEDDREDDVATPRDRP